MDHEEKMIRPNNSSHFLLLLRREMREYPVAKIEPEADPNLETMSDAELYRMLALLDMLEEKQTEKVPQRELETLKFLMDSYHQRR